MQLILLSGAGGTGKSTVTDLMAKRKDCHVMRSSSRKTYARLGIPTETAAFGMSIEQQKHLQEEILKDHLAAFQAAYDEAQGSEYLVIDRGPFDHMAYWVRTNALEGSGSTPSDFIKYIGRICMFLADLKVETISMFDFPFPTPWSTVDGQRDQNLVKTLEMSLMTTGLLYRFVHLIREMTHPDVYLNDVDLGSPENRVDFIIRTAQAQLRSKYGVHP